MTDSQYHTNHLLKREERACSPRLTGSPVRSENFLFRWDATDPIMAEFQMWRCSLPLHGVRCGTWAHLTRWLKTERCLLEHYKSWYPIRKIKMLLKVAHLVCLVPHQGPPATNWNAAQRRPYSVSRVEYLGNGTTSVKWLSTRDILIILLWPRVSEAFKKTFVLTHW